MMILMVMMMMTVGYGADVDGVSNDDADDDDDCADDDVGANDEDRDIVGSRYPRGFPTSAWTLDFRVVLLMSSRRRSSFLPTLDV